VSLDTPFGRNNQAGVDNVWEQKKPEASLPKRSEGVHALFARF
jgi:hypothetical protein